MSRRPHRGDDEWVGRAVVCGLVAVAVIVAIIALGVWLGGGT